jgi:hypothetical protein
MPTENAPPMQRQPIARLIPKKPATGNPMADVLMSQFQACIVNGVADAFLDILLNLMSLVFLFDHKFRQNIEGFSGRYHFVNKQWGSSTGAIFENNRLEVSNKVPANPDITITFKDGQAIMDYLLTPKPDILGSMLRQEVSLNGNLNYLYKFAYMARRLQLMAMGQI